MNKTLFIKNIDGSNLDITKRFGKLQEVKPAQTLFASLFNSDGIAKNIEGFKEFEIPLAVKSELQELVDSNSFAGASDLQISKVTATSKTLLDSKILRDWDNTLLDNRSELAAVPASNFMNQFAVNATKKLILDSVSAAKGYKLYTNGSDWSKTKSQTAFTDGTTAKAVEAITNGTRAVAVNKAEFTAKNNALDLVRSAVMKLEGLGTDNDTEKYPFAHEGMEDIVIVGSPRSIRNLKGDGFTRVLNNGEAPKPNAMVASIDTYPLHLSKLLPANVEYMVMTKRSLFLLLATSDPSVILGQIYKTKMVPTKKSDGSRDWVPLLASDAAIDFQRTYMSAVKYNGEIIVIESK